MNSYSSSLKPCPRNRGQARSLPLLSLAAPSLGALYVEPTRQTKGLASTIAPGAAGRAFRPGRKDRHRALVAAPSFSPTSPNSCPSPKLASARLGRAESSSSGSSMVFVGIDVSKQRLDVHVRPTGEQCTFDNDTKGHARLIEKLAALTPTLVVLEATGGYQAAVTAELGCDQHRCCGRQPAPGARLRKGHGQTGQDRCDRRGCASAVRRGRPTRATASPRRAHGRAACTRHSSPAAHRHAHGRDERLETCRVLPVRRNIQKMINSAQQADCKVDDNIDTTIRNSPAVA